MRVKFRRKTVGNRLEAERKQPGGCAPRQGRVSGGRRPTVLSDGGMPEALGPGGEPLGCPGVVEQFQGRQCVDICFGKAAGKLGAFGLGGEADAFPFPLDILRRPARDHLPEEEVNHSGTHRFQETGITRFGAIPVFWLATSSWGNTA